MDEKIMRLDLWAFGLEGHTVQTYLRSWLVEAITRVKYPDVEGEADISTYINVTRNAVGYFLSDKAFEPVGDIPCAIARGNSIGKYYGCRVFSERALRDRESDNQKAKISVVGSESKLNFDIPGITFFASTEDS